MWTFYTVRQDRRQEALREQMLELHESQLTEVAERYMEFRGRIEDLVQEAAEGGEPEAWADPRLSMRALRSREGLYLRIRSEAAAGSEEIRSGALIMEPDRIHDCLGTSPMSVRGLYEKGEFLTPGWVENLRSEEDMMALRVLDDQLGRHIQVDAPVVLSMMQARWFMLVIQQGESRRDHPVDVFIWDLRENRQLLRARIQGRGLLVPVRLRFEGVQAGPGATINPRSGGATDCSIGSQITELMGAEPLEFDSSDEVVEAAEARRAAEEAAAAEAEAEEGSEESEGAEEPPEGESEAAEPQPEE